MFAGVRIQALVFQAQAFYRDSTYDVRLNDLVDVIFGDFPVPDRIRVHDQIGSMLALIEASGLVGADSAL